MKNHRLPHAVVAMTLMRGSSVFGPANSERQSASNFPPESWHRRRRLWAGALLVLAIAAAYWNSLDAPFVFDDRPAIVENPTIRQLWGSWRTPENGSSAVGRPLVNLSFALNYALSGMSVRGYHVVNLLLHVWAALTLWGVSRRTLLRAATAGAESLAFGAALLWALHPLLTESVTCVVQRNEVMTGLFYLLILYGFARSIEPGARVKWWQALAVAACWLGVFTKEVIATAPLLVLLYDRAFVAGTFRAAWERRKWFLLALLSSWLPLVMLIVAGGQRTGTAGFGLGIGAWDYLLTQCRAIALYLKLSFWPHPLIIDYGVPVVRDWLEVAGRGMLLLGLLGATAWSLVKRPAVGFLGACFFVILAPSSSFVPLTTQTIAEHRMYLPLAAVVLAAVLALRTIVRHGFPAAVAVLALVLASATVRRNEVYRDEFRLWRRTIADLPENPRGYSSLGNAYTRRADWEKAIEQYQEAVRLRPDFADAHNNLGLSLLEVGRRDAALAHLEAAARLKPDDADIRYNLGNGYAAAERPDDAIEQLGSAVELRPDFPAADKKLGAVWLQRGQPQRAAHAYAAAVRTRPDDVEALAGWGSALWQLGDGAGAIEKYRAALHVAPEMANLHYNLANVLMGLNRLPDAEKEYNEALARDVTSPAAHHNLGLVLLGMGRSAEAVPHFEAAVRALPDSARTHANLSRALAQSGRIKEALTEADSALRLQPQDDELRAFAARLRNRMERLER